MNRVGVVLKTFTLALETFVRLSQYHVMYNTNIIIK